MIPISRLLLVLIVGLTIVYVSLWFYFRTGTRDRLLAEWKRDRPPLPEHTYVENGLRDTRDALRRKLVLGVYVVPITLVVVTALILNYA